MVSSSVKQVDHVVLPRGRLRGLLQVLLEARFLKRLGFLLVGSEDKRRERLPLDDEFFQKILLEKIGVVAFASLFATRAIGFSSRDSLDQNGLETVFRGVRGELADSDCQSGFVTFRFAAHDGVPVVLDRIVGPTWDDLRKDRPLVPVELMQKEKFPLFFFAPDRFDDRGVQVVMPSFTTLFPLSSGHKVGDGAPFRGAETIDESHQDFVFLGRPNFFLAFRPAGFSISPTGGTRTCGRLLSDFFHFKFEYLDCHIPKNHIYPFY